MNGEDGALLWSEHGLCNGARRAFVWHGREIDGRSKGEGAYSYARALSSVGRLAICVDIHPFSWAGEALDRGFEADSTSLDL